MQLMRQKIVLDMEVQVAVHPVTDQVAVHPNHQVVMEVAIHHVLVVTAVIKQPPRKSKKKQVNLPNKQNQLYEYLFQKNRNFNFCFIRLNQLHQQLKAMLVKLLIKLAKVN
jgi:hypothetical protein